ncbi:MAG: alkaline phosphatase family protein [Acidimicrobiales bacterium]
MLTGVDRRAASRRLRSRDLAADAQRLPDTQQPAGTDLLPQIGHIVLLMMENHSFDNYFGRLGRGDGFTLDAGGQPVNENRAQDGSAVRVHHLGSTVQQSGVPTQAWRASHLQFDDGANDGFVHSVEDAMPGRDASIPMGYWTEADLPFYASLARTFPLANRWFCSCLGPTFPNRRFLMAATANGLIDDIPTGMSDYPDTGTSFDLLDRHDIEWVNYHHTKSWRTIATRILGGGGLRSLRALGLLASKLLPSILTTTQGNFQYTADLYPLGLVRCLRHLRTIDRFWVDAQEGTLPPVCIVDPDFQACSEENPQDIRTGEGFAAKVIDAVMQGKGWEHTLLIWFYDEHGGYYDHVPPPAAVEPDDVQPHSLLAAGGPIKWLVRTLGFWKKIEAIDTGGGRYDRYGMRVPAVVVSPYAKAHFVSDTVYDHASALKLIEQKWNLPPLTKRDASAVAPLDMLSFDQPPAFLDPPRLASPAVAWPPSVPPTSAGVRLAQQAGFVGTRTVPG